MNFIDRFCATVGPAVISPEQYVWWAGAATVSAIMGRLIWTHTWVNKAEDHVFGNLFVLLVGAPGIGKTNAVREARRVLGAIGCKLGPDDITGERLYEELLPPKIKDPDDPKGRRKIRAEARGDEGTQALFLKEFDSLMHSGQASAAKRLLNELYDCSDRLSRKTYAHDDQEPVDLCATLLAAVTPAHLNEHFAPLEWQEGLPSRFVYVYGELPDFREDYARGDMKGLFNHAREITKFIGMTTAVSWAPDAMTAYKDWTRSVWGGPSQHMLLEGYNRRRPLSLAKLAFICAVGDLSAKIELRHLEMAEGALAVSERTLDKCLALAGGNPTKDVEGFIRGWLSLRKDAPEWQVRQLIAVRVSHYLIEGVLNELVNSRVLVPATLHPAPNRVFKGGLWENQE